VIEGGLAALTHDLGIDRGSRLGRCAVLQEGLDAHGNRPPKKARTHGLDSVSPRLKARRGEAFGYADAQTLTRSLNDPPALKGGEEGPVLGFRKAAEAVEDDFERGALLGRTRVASSSVLSLVRPLS